MLNEALEIIISLLKKFEGCRLVAYQDVVGVWTIGYGETLGVVPGMVWTQEEAEGQLRRRATYFLLSTLAKCPQLHHEPSERVAACVSLTYNIGESAFGISSVSRKTTRKDYPGAATSFLLWDKARGRVIRALTIRRKIESQLYLKA
jgi:lysozyme